MLGIIGMVILGGGVIACDTELESGELHPLVQAAELKEGEIAIAAFVNPGECSKCELSTNALFTWTKQNVPNRIKVKTLAMIPCNRDVELEAYRKAYPTYDYMLRSTKELRDLLNVPTTTRLVILDAKGDVIGRMTETEFLEKPIVSMAQILQHSSAISNEG